MQWKQPWSETNMKMARYASYCQACNRPIRIGEPILYHFSLRRFVHSECRAIRVPARNKFTPTTPARVPVPRDILGPDSPLDQLSTAYRQEAVRWVQFHADCEAIPGIHVPFNTRGVESYLSHRAQTTKCLPFIKCALKKMGMVCNYSLHTSKYQQPSIQYQQIQDHCNELRKTRRGAGLDGVINEAMAYGSFSLSRVYASFDIRSYRRFRRCHRVHRMYMCISAKLHSGCV